VASGQSYERSSRKRVFDPLGMADTTSIPSAEQRKRLATTYGKGKDGKLASSGLVADRTARRAKHPIPAGGLVSSGPDLRSSIR
jgi:CubicO group peptidase (beta-lactamase class C family)